MYRFEDKGLTLRLFKDQKDAASLPGLTGTPMPYAFGWLVKETAGRYVDAHGMLPASWKPSAEHLKS